MQAGCSPRGCFVTVGSCGGVVKIRRSQCLPLRHCETRLLRVEDVLKAGRVEAIPLTPRALVNPPPCPVARSQTTYRGRCQALCWVISGVLRQVPGTLRFLKRSSTAEASAISHPFVFIRLRASLTPGVRNDNRGLVRVCRRVVLLETASSLAFPAGCGQGGSFLAVTRGPRNPSFRTRAVFGASTSHHTLKRR